MINLFIALSLLRLKSGSKVLTVKDVSLNLKLNLMEPRGKRVSVRFVAARYMFLAFLFCLQMIFPISFLSFIQLSIGNEAISLTLILIQSENASNVLILTQFYCVVVSPSTPLSQHKYSPQCSLYTSFGFYKENLVKNQQPFKSAIISLNPINLLSDCQSLSRVKS